MSCGVGLLCGFGAKFATSTRCWVCRSRRLCPVSMVPHPPPASAAMQGRCSHPLSPGGEAVFSKPAAQLPAHLTRSSTAARRDTPVASVNKTQHQPPKLGGQWPQRRHLHQPRHFGLAAAAAGGAGVAQSPCCEQDGMHGCLDRSVVQVMASCRPPGHRGPGERHRFRVDVKARGIGLSDAEQRPRVTRTVGRVDPAGPQSAQSLGPHPAGHCNLEGRPGPGRQARLRDGKPKSRPKNPQSQTKKGTAHASVLHDRPPIPSPAAMD